MSSSRVRGVGGEEGLHLCGGEEGLHRFFFRFFFVTPVGGDVDDDVVSWWRWFLYRLNFFFFSLSLCGLFWGVGFFLGGGSLFFGFFFGFFFM